MRYAKFLNPAVAFAVLLPATAAVAQVDTGSADFSRYVAMGDSLTAAFSSGGLVDAVQTVSYPSLVHRQATGGGGFEQPLVSAPGIPPLLQLVSLQPVVLAPAAGMGQPLNLFLGRPYDNLGVPGADVADVLRTVTDDGGAHDLILRGLGTQLQQALALSPTVVSLWIGNNDALGAATSGIVIDGVTLTPLATFETDYRTIAGAITSRGAQLVVATVPNVTSIPFVNTIPPFIEVPGTGQRVPLIGPRGPLGAGDNVLLTASGLLARGIGIPVALGGTGQPLPDQVVLDSAETSRVQNRVNGFNSVIRTVAGEVGAAVVDTSGFFDGLVRDGLVLGGIEYSTEFLTGGLFSYDGVHPTALGYALAANEFIDAINGSFGARIPPVDLLPFVFGEVGAPVGNAVVFGAAQARRAIFGDAAWEGLAWGLGLDRVQTGVGPEPPGGTSGGPVPGYRTGPPVGDRAAARPGQPAPASEVPAFRRELPRRFEAEREPRRQ